MKYKMTTKEKIKEGDSVQFCGFYILKAKELIDSGFEPDYFFIEDDSKNQIFVESEYNQALEDVHGILADFYDEKLEENEVNAKRNYSRIIRELKERIEGLKKWLKHTQ